MICKTCSFVTNRLLVKEWHSLTANDWIAQDLPQVASTMLTPAVTRSLPEGDFTIERAKEWIEERDREGATLLVVERSSRSPVGQIILIENDDAEFGRTIRRGYLLSELSWGRGLASALVQGFVAWSRTVEIESIVAGVERDNVPSQRVLGKNGFAIQSTVEDDGDLFFELRL